MKKLKIFLILIAILGFMGLNYSALNADPSYVYAKSMHQKEMTEYSYGFGGNASLDPSGLNAGVEGKAEKTVKGVRYYCSWDFSKCDTNKQRTEWFK
jgi:hypothetical protein